MGDPRDFTNFVNAVIDQASFDNIMGYIQKAKEANDAEVVLVVKATTLLGTLLNQQ